MVTISFDDSFRLEDYNSFYDPIFNGRKNPNGCQIGVTVFNSHRYTDYALVEHAYSMGYEFASHSVTHRTPTTFWEQATEDQLKDEILGQKSILNAWGGVPSGDVVGFRAPFLATSETELKVLHENGMLYDASMSSTTPYWPFTLDYKSPLCTSPSTCPEHAYPGLWVVPNRSYMQSNGFACAMLDACTAPVTEDQWYTFLVDNFNTHYNGNRSPFTLYAHSAWFFYPGRVEAMVRFLNKMADMEDVYTVTHTQMLDWVRDPTPLSQIDGFAPWKCPPRPAPRCAYTAATCTKTFTSPEFAQLKSCAPVCPVKYPGIGNPLGQ